MISICRHTLRLILSALGFVLISCAAHASMELSNVIFHFEPGEAARQDVEVFNSGEQPLYVEITPTVVRSPGDAGEKREVIKDPRESGLLVTPNRLIVPPGASKMVRMVKMGNSPDERVYRVTAKPVIGGLEADQSGVKVMIGYELLAIVYPPNPRPDIVVQRNGQQLIVRNQGNTNVLFREGYQCERDDLPREECAPLPGKRVYPGNEWIIDLPLDRPVTYYQSTGTRNFVETYP